MNMKVTYWLNSEDKERCFQILRKGTAFEKEPAYITAYEVCKGLNEYYSGYPKKYIPLRDAHTGKPVIEGATADNINKMIRWLREKHDIFYFQAMNLCIPLEDPLSKKVKDFWDGDDERQKQIEEFRIDIELFDKQRLEKERDELKEKCDNLVKRLEEIDEYGYGGHVCSGCKGRVCDQFIDILNALGIKEGALYPERGQSKVDAFAKAAKYRAEIIFSEHQKMQKQVDELNERIHNQEQIIKTQNESLTKQRKQLKDLGASLRDIKEVVDCEMDDLMKTHGDDVIPIF